MGHRLSKIYTRTGDKGTTGLGNGSRVDKDTARIEAIGTIDELNSIIGLLLAETVPDLIRETLIDVQHHLFDIGGGLSIPGSEVPETNYIEKLEMVLDELNSELEPLKEFILPGGTRTAALCHQARSVCRRAERRVVTLAKTEAISEFPCRYLNRLSDLLFVMARSVNRTAGRPDILWQPGRLPK
jgi:cob(I)alamin adenosyltransferase